jgi:hypothetical protein
MPATVEGNDVVLRAWLAARTRDNLRSRVVPQCPRSGDDARASSTFFTSTSRQRKGVVPRWQQNGCPHMCCVTPAALVTLQATKDLRKVSVWLGHAPRANDRNLHSGRSIGEARNIGIDRRAKTSFWTIHGDGQVNCVTQTADFYAETIVPEWPENRVSGTRLCITICGALQLPVDHWNEVTIRDRLEHSTLTVNITGDTYRGQSEKTYFKEKRRVELPNRGSAGNPCKVGPFTRNRAGRLREIVQSVVP